MSRFGQRSVVRCGWWTRLFCAAILATCQVTTPWTARAASPDNEQARLAIVLAQGLDRSIRTERGGIRIIGFGRGKAKNGALFFIHGDPEWHRIGAFSEDLRAEETRVLVNHLEWLRGIAAASRYATYFVARTGVFGSEGETNDFRGEESYLSIGRAIDKVIETDGARSVAIVGHSGGAAVALYHAIALPSASVPCYVLASGVYNIGAISEFMRQEALPGADVSKLDRNKLGSGTFRPLSPEMVTKYRYFEPLFRLAELPADPRRRIIAVSNRRDTTAPFFASDDLVARLKAAGHRADLVEGAARPPNFHYTYESGVKAALGCLADSAKR